MNTAATYLDHLTSTQQALVLGRDAYEAIELLNHALGGDLCEAYELDRNIAKLDRAGYGTTDMQRRRAAVTRSIRSTERAIAAVEGTVAV